MQVEVEIASSMKDDDVVDRHWRHTVRLDEIAVLPSSLKGDEKIQQQRQQPTVGLYLVCGEWTDERLVKQQSQRIRPVFRKLMEPHLLLYGDRIHFDFGIIHLQDDDLCRLCGDDDDNVDCKNGINNNNTHATSLPCPPEYLPVFLLVIRLPSMPQPHIHYLTGLSADAILKMWRGGHTDDVSVTSQEELSDELRSFGLTAINLLPVPEQQQALRIFVAGDSMSVGKTSVCLGILGNLVQAGYAPDTLAYIKPATQNEKPQLVQRYCEKLGIPCVSVGPVVYYRGFTRAYLAGETESSEELLAKVSAAVDEMAFGKSVVVIDGVGFPAVGSICGTDNASVALASSYPDDDATTSSSEPIQRKPLGVLLVGGPGVGSAVDAFNLNATYFEAAGVPVLGAIFNKLLPDGFYSLENCKKEISLYFSRNDHQIRNGRRPLGFCPLYDKLGGKDAKDHVLDYIRVFGDHFDTRGLIERAQEVKESASLVTVASLDHPIKRQKVSNAIHYARTREEIENAAIQSGAAPSA